MTRGRAIRKLACRLPIILGLAGMCPAGLRADDLPRYTLADVIEQAREARELRACCGPLSLARGLALLGRPVPFQTLRDQFTTKTDAGVTLQELLTLAQTHHSESRGVTINTPTLHGLPVPAILVVDQGRHCVVLERFSSDGREAHVWDPARLEAALRPTSELRAAMTGEAILLTPPDPPTLSDGVLLGIACTNLSLAIWLWTRRRAPNHPPA